MEFFVQRNDCLICGRQSPRTIYNAPMHKGIIFDFINKFHKERIPLEVLRSAPYQLFMCNCGFVWQRFVLNDYYMTQFYTKWIPTSESLAKRTEANVSYFHNLAKNLTFLKTQLPNLNQLTSLDYGMGWGHWAISALSFGFESYGFEISAERVIYASERGVKIINNLESTEKKFDVINIEQVLEHLQKPNQTLSMLASKLNKGGIMQIAVPNGTSEIRQIVKQRWTPRKGAMQPLDHINTFTPLTLINMAAQHGLKYEKATRLFNPINGNMIISVVDICPINLLILYQGDKMCFRKI